MLELALSLILVAGAPQPAAPPPPAPPARPEVRPPQPPAPPAPPKARAEPAAERAAAPPPRASPEASAPDGTSSPGQSPASASSSAAPAPPPATGPQEGVTAAPAREETEEPPEEKAARALGISKRKRAAPKAPAETQEGRNIDPRGVHAAREVYSKKNLCDELMRQGKDLASARARLDEERTVLENERRALERLRLEVADARAQLRAETQRLEGLLAKPRAGADADRRADEAGERAEAVTVSPGVPHTAPKPQLVIRASELDSIALTMKSMKPDAAAALVQRSEPALAAALLKRMKPKEAGAVLDRLKPDTAAELVSLMASTAAPRRGAAP